MYWRPGKAVASATTGKILYIKDSDGSAGASNITIDGNGAELIDASTTFVLSSNYQSVTLINLGDKWVVI